MEQWEDQGIVLALRPHGENAAIVSVLTETQGRTCGYVHGARGAKLRGALQQGNLVNVQWSARTSENLGAFKVEEIRSSGALLASDPMKLSALLSACALCDAALPEREAHPGLFEGLKALLNLMNESDIWPAAYNFTGKSRCCVSWGSVSILRAARAAGRLTMSSMSAPKAAAR